MTTWAEARGARDDLAREIEEACESEQPPRLADYARAWLERRTPLLRPAVVEAYSRSLGYLTASLGDVLVDRLRPADGEMLVAELVQAKLAPATVRGILKVARGVVRDAARDYDCRDWARELRGPRVARTGGARGQGLDAEQARRLASTIEAMGRRGARPRRGIQAGISADTARMLLVLMCTGMRRGELFALRAADIDGDEIVVERSVYRRHESATKTDEPRRVAISPYVQELLREQRRWLVAEQHPALSTGLLFPAEPGHARRGAKDRRGEVAWYRGSNAVAGPLRKACVEADVPRVSPHALRRLCTMTMERAGVAEDVRMAQQGWRSHDARRIYETVEKMRRVEAAAAVERLFVGASGDSSGDPAGQKGADARQG